MNFKEVVYPISKFITNQIRSKYFNNIIWMFVDKGVKLLSELVVGLYIARYLGAELFGLLSFAISYVTITYGISSLGLSGLLTRELINFKFQHSKILGTSLTLRVAAALFFIICINLSAHFVIKNYEARLIVFLISGSVLWKAFDIFESFFQSFVVSEKIAQVHLACNLVTSLMKILFVIQQQPVTYFAFAYSLEWFLTAVGLGVFYLFYKEVSGWRFNKAIALILLRNSWPLIISGLAVDLYMRVDQIMIRQMMGDAANGYYAIGTKISEMWYAIPVITCSILFPALLNARNTNKDLYDRRILSLFSLMFWSSLLVAAIIAPLSKTIIVFMYTEAYASSSQVLSIHIWAAIFVFLGVSTTYWSLSENLQYISLIRTVSGLFVNIALNIVLIPAYGINGAAVATLISQAIASSFSLLIFQKTRKVFYLQVESIFLPLSLLRR